MEKRNILEIFNSDNHDYFLIPVITVLHDIIGSYSVKISGFIGIADFLVGRIGYLHVGDKADPRPLVEQRRVINSMSIEMLRRKKQANKSNEGDDYTIIYKDIAISFAGLASPKMSQAVSLVYAIYLYNIQKNGNIKTNNLHQLIAQDIMLEYSKAGKKNDYLKDLAEILNKKITA